MLRQILSQSTGDVFTLIAAALQNAGGRQATFFAAPGGVQPAGGYFFLWQGQPGGGQDKQLDACLNLVNL